MAAIEGREPPRAEPPELLPENLVAWQVFELALSGVRRGLGGEPLGLDLAAVVELVRARGGDLVRDVAKVVALYHLWVEMVERPELEKGGIDTARAAEHRAPDTGP